MNHVFSIHTQGGAVSRPNDVWSTLLAQLGKEPRVAWLGLLGVLCALIGFARGFDVPTEWNLWETATRL